MIKSLFTFVMLAALLGAGRVQTRDGKTIDGDITLADGGVSVQGRSQTRVSWDDVARLTLQLKTAPDVLKPAKNGVLPADWKNQDIGGVKYPGSTSCESNGLFTLSASGWGAWGAKDSLQFAGQPLDGDGQIIAHVGKLDNSNGPVIAGVMIRQSTSPDSPMAGACLYPSGEVRMPRRPVGVAHDFKHNEEVAPQGWVRLARAGEMLSAYRSADGKYWQLVDKRKVVMDQKVLIGVAAWTTGNAWSSSAQIDQVRIIPGTPSLSYFPGAGNLISGVVFRDGNAVAATVGSIDKDGLHYDVYGDKRVTPIDAVARIVFAPVPADFAKPGEKTGILLTSGDFIEGDLAALSVQQVEWPRPPQLKATVRSVIFGSRSFEIAKEVIAIDLAPLAPAPAAYEIEFGDGSVRRVKTLAIEKDAFVVDGQTLKNVAEVRKL